MGTKNILCAPEVSSSIFGNPLCELNYRTPDVIPADPQSRADDSAVDLSLQAYHSFMVLLNAKPYSRCSELAPNTNYRVSLVPILKSVSSVGCLTYLQMRHSVLLHEPCLKILLSSLRFKLPRDAWMIAFSSKHLSVVDSGSEHTVPVARVSLGVDTIDYGRFSHQWGVHYNLLCINNVE
jgi:hypothetical protein